jgi:hypothetical protein
MSALELPWGTSLKIHGGVSDSGEKLPTFALWMCPRCVAMVVEEFRDHHERWHQTAVGEVIP